MRGADPDERTLALAALLQALDRLAPVLGIRGGDARGVKRRLQDLTAGDWTAKAVREAVQATVVTMTSATTIAATTGAVAGI